MGTGKRETSLPFKREEGLRELQAAEHQLCAWEDHGTGPPGRHVKAHVRRTGDSTQPAQFHQGNVVPYPIGVLR